MRFWLIAGALPALAALGHDAVMFYLNQDRDFMFSTPGYLWTHYAPGSYKWTAENAGPDLWALTETILAQKSVFLGLGFAIVVYVILWLVSLGRPKANKSVKTKRFKYARR